MSEEQLREEIYQQQLAEMEEWKEYSDKPQHELISEIILLKKELRELKELK